MDATSFDEVAHRYAEARPHIRHDAVIAIVGNKIDLGSTHYNDADDAEMKHSHHAQHAAVCRDIGREYADSIGAMYFEVSAKTGANVEAMFMKIAQVLVDQERCQPCDGVLGVPGNERGERPHGKKEEKMSWLPSGCSVM